MKAFIVKQERYCPKMERNIVLEHRVSDGKTEEICLNRHEYNCERCENKLLEQGDLFTES